MKRLINVMGIILMAGVFAFSVTASAQDTNMGKSAGKWSGTQRGRGMMDNTGNKSTLTDEQQAQIEKLRKKFREDNADIIKELMTKRFDLNTILSSDNPAADKAKAAQKEISELNAKLAQKRIELHLELIKIAPDADPGLGRARGMGRMGRIGVEGGL